MSDMSDVRIKKEMKAADRSIKIYTQRFRKAWKTRPELKEWLREEISDASKAYCRYCRCNLQAKLCELQTHAKTKKHLKAAESYTHVKENLQEYVKTSSRIGPKSSIKSEEVAMMVSADDMLSADNLAVSVSEDDEDLHLEQYMIEVEGANGSMTKRQQKLQDERARAEIDYFQTKSLYFSKMSDLSQIQKTLMVLQARKLQLEIERLRDE